MFDFDTCISIYAVKACEWAGVHSIDDEDNPVRSRACLTVQPVTNRDGQVLAVLSGDITPPPGCPDHSVSLLSCPGNHLSELGRQARLIGRYYGVAVRIACNNRGWRSWDATGHEDGDPVKTDQD